jgi:hypothetical protein
MLLLGVAHLAAGSEGGKTSVAAHGGEPDQPEVSTRLVAGAPIAPAARCPAAQHAISHYRRQYTASRNTMGLPGAVPRVWYPCPAAKRRAAEWQTKARKAKAALFLWRNNQYQWEQWLPDKWQRIGACETGYGKRPGNWRHNSGAYQGAFGFARSSWDAFVPYADPQWGPYPSEAYEATPRQQYEVALAIYRRYGLSGWGCRGA